MSSAINIYIIRSRIALFNASVDNFNGLQVFDGPSFSLIA